ncbi:MAG: DNA adenine methylase [Candidatus Thermoplasmatota archaeon]|jgi:DNA adenine methylase|nr:DNA adenine methylase [Candidatus Thermoplasmatota archaeon]
MNPLVKWAGGKRQLLPRIMKCLPDSWNTYYEPFSGGLALLVEMYNRGKVNKAVIGDANPELMNLYSTVKNFPTDLVNAISEFGFSNDPACYYEIRNKFNSLIGDQYRSAERAAMFLYLNRHCFNGLWRVNSDGKFNVPFGKYSNPSLPTEGHIFRFSQMLKQTRIVTGDFSEVTGSARKGDFVYFDPPYFPLSRSSSFTYYAQRGFGFSDQIRLRDLCRELDRNDIRFLLSNSSSKEMMELFGEFRIKRVSVNRFINSVAEKRTGHHEILVTNYSVETGGQEEHESG